MSDGRLGPPSMSALPSERGVAVASPSALEVAGISKSYGTVQALRDVSFTVPSGQIVGLLGPNGAGKSTTMKAILGLVRPEAGTIRLFGSDVLADPPAAKRQIGYVPESPSLYEFLTGTEYLDFIADMYGLDRALRRERIGQFLVGLELAGHEDSLISGYSQGMKQKVALIAALAHRPRLLVLDEPLNGLDPRSARVTKDLLRNLASHEGVSVLFSTHVLEIAQAICDRVVILHRGAVLASGTFESLRSQAGLGGSDLEEVFLALTGSGDLRDVVDALAR
jgi:ABC-2 type transport system ATP-binding protein